MNLSRSNSSDATSTSNRSRSDLMSLTEECSKVTGIPYLMEAYRDEAMVVLDS